MDSALADAGIKFDFILHDGNVDIASDLNNLDAFERQHPGSIVGIEGPNEINDQTITYDGITDTFAAGAQVTKDLWFAVQSDPTLAGVPVYELSVSDGFTDIRSGEAELGNLSSDVTYNNVHIYGSGGENLWSDAMPYWLPIEQASAPGVPTVVTETGYQTSGQAGTDAVDETVAAKYDLNTVFDEAANGIALLRPGGFSGYVAADVRVFQRRLVGENAGCGDAQPDDHIGCGRGGRCVWDAELFAFGAEFDRAFAASGERLDL